MNSHLNVLTKAAEVFLQGRTEGVDPVQAVLPCVPEAQLQAVVSSAKQLLRPEDLDSFHVIESRSPLMQQSLLALIRPSISNHFVGVNQLRRHWNMSLCTCHQRPLAQLKYPN